MPVMTNQQPGQPLTPTFVGYISSTMDALVLFEACLTGKLSHVPRRPHDRERSSLIQSGHIFIYEENASGIKRWTDGVPWSPSRILGNFLIYRELDAPFQPGEKKRAMKRNRSGGVTKPITEPKMAHGMAFGSAPLAPTGAADAIAGNNGNDMERSYLGSLIDSYKFKESGLVKKTISVQYKGIQHHLVSYYSLNDARESRLPKISNAALLRGVIPRAELVSSANFRAPVDDNDFSCFEPPMRGYGYNPTIDPESRDEVPSQSLPIPPSVPQLVPYTETPVWVNPPHYSVPESPYSLPQGLPQSHPPFPEPILSYTYGNPYSAPPPQQSGCGPMTLPQGLPQSHPPYPEPVLSYTYGNPYSASPPQPPGCGPMTLPLRPHPEVSDMNGIGQAGYPANTMTTGYPANTNTSTAGFLTNEDDHLTSHGLHEDSYLNVNIFSAPVNDTATEGTTMVPNSGYSPTNTMGTMSRGGASDTSDGWNGQFGTH